MARWQSFEWQIKCLMISVYSLEFVCLFWKCFSFGNIWNVVHAAEGLGYSPYWPLERASGQGNALPKYCKMFPSWKNHSHPPAQSIKCLLMPCPFLHLFSFLIQRCGLEASFQIIKSCYFTDQSWTIDTNTYFSLWWSSKFQLLQCS